MSQTFDYREILKTLNSIGYSNISAAELKAFKKDLNALIKYESGNSSKENINVQERLHSARQNKENDGIGQMAVLVNPTKQMNNNSNSHWRQQLLEVQRSVKKSVNRRTQTTDEKKDKEKQIDAEQPPQSIAKSQKFTNTTIQHCERAKLKFPTKRILVKNTPVDLYHKYQSDWEKFKKYIPGENSREDVRKEIRKTMQKPLPPKATLYIHYANDHKYAYDR